MMPHTSLSFHDKKRSGTWPCVVNEPLFSGNYVIVCLRIHYNIRNKMGIIFIIPSRCRIVNIQNRKFVF